MHTFYGALSITIGNIQRAFRHLEPALALAEEIGDAALLANVLPSGENTVATTWDR